MPILLPNTKTFRTGNALAVIGLFLLPFSGESQNPQPGEALPEVPEKLATSGREAQKAPAPDWVKRFEFDPYEEPEEKENVGSVYFYVIDSQKDTASETDYYRYLKRLMTESGVADNSQLSVSFDPTYQKLIFHSLLVHRDGKTIDKLPSQKIKVIERESNHEKQLYDGSLSAIAVIEDIRIGDTIEYSYSLVGKNPVMGERYSDSFSTNYSSPVGHLRTSIRWGGDRELKVKHFDTDLTPKITNHEDYTLYEWSDDHIPALLSDGGLPSDYSPWGWVDLSDYESWEEVKDWASKQYVFSDELPPSLEKEIAPILEAAKTDEEKIRAALRYVQDEYRYLGIFSGVHSHKPYPIDTIVKRRFGDCKDKSLLLTTILRSEGFEAYPTLVETDFRGEIAEWLPSPYAFDHLVVTLRLNGETIRLDPTRSYQRGPLRDIYFPDYGKVLVISPNTKDLEDVEPQGYDVKFTDIVENFDFPDYEGGATLKVVTTYTGQAADSTRDYFAYNGADEVKKEYLNFYSAIFPEIEFTGPITTEDDEEKNEFVVREEYAISNIWEAADEDDPGEGYEVELFGKSVYQRINLPSTRTRTMPYAIGYPVRFKQTINAIFSTNTEFEGTDLEIDDPAFHFSAKETPKKKGIQLVYQYESKKNRVNGERISEYIRNAKKAEAKLSYFVWIPGSLHLGEGVSNSSETGSYPVNFVLIALVLTALGMTSLLAFILYKWRPSFQRPVIFNPQLQGIGGWLVLVAIGVCVRPLISLYSVGNVVYYSDLNTWISCVSPGGELYDPLWQYLLTAEGIIAPFFFVIDILIVVMFFQKRYTLPRILVVYFVLLWLSALTCWGMANAIENFDPETLREYQTDAIRTFFHTLIWSTYFAVSKRVRATFVNGAPESADHITEKKPSPPPLPTSPLSQGSLTSGPDISPRSEESPGL